MSDSARIANSDTSLATDREQWRLRYQQVRAFSEHVCEPLAVEDMVIQSMPDVSPSKWHLAHTSWFFETFILTPYDAAYRSPHPRYAMLFNSYYNGIGEQFPRPRRGLLSRPTVAEVYAYRRHVDHHLLQLLTQLTSSQWSQVAPLLELGLQHEQQHQELLLTDIKHVLYQNPLAPTYRPQSPIRETTAPPLSWLTVPQQECLIGHQGAGFAFDNEGPAHPVLLQPFALASRPVSNAEYLAFVTDGGYQRPEFWLSDGWLTVQAERWQAPLYWQCTDNTWQHFTLHGLQPLHPAAPVCHLSYFEADAYAHWYSLQHPGVRLPTEFEWEAMARSVPVTGHFVDHGALQPHATDTTTALHQLYGGVWEWTASAYAPYPGYHPPSGAIGEYNGKFMCNQYVLRGGSCVSSQNHLRASYRNFFPPHARWQFSGIRLASSL